MADWNIKVNELVRELRRRTIGLKNSVDERRQVVNVAPINDRRQSERFVSKPAPTDYQWILTAESGPLEGMRYAVTAPIVVGNDDDCDLTLIAPQVSLHHTRFTLEKHRLYVEDMGSIQGTLLNGELVTDKQPLHHGDLVKLHDSRFRVAEGYFRSNSLDNLLRQERTASSAVAE
ncbi:MAG: FHA domain-containing protein [Halieaceae bacterium]